MLDPHPGQPDPGEDVRWDWEVTNLTDRPIENVTVSFVNARGGGTLATTPNPGTIPARGSVTFTRTFSHPARDYAATPLEMVARAYAADQPAADLAPWARAGVPVQVGAGG